MILSLVDLQEGQLIPQYYYVSNSNKHVNKKDEERIIMAVLQWFLLIDDRTRSLLSQCFYFRTAYCDCNEIN